MDRFIEHYISERKCGEINLKSSMDRFIVWERVFMLLQKPHLKSSMDRFIAALVLLLVLLITIFKIQYG